MKIFNIMLMISLLVVTTIPAAFAECTSCAQKMTAEEFVKQTHQQNQNENLVQNCSGFDPRGCR